MDNLYILQDFGLDGYKIQDTPIVLPSGKFMINLNKPPSHAVYERMISTNELDSSMRLIQTRKRVKSWCIYLGFSRNPDLPFH